MALGIPPRARAEGNPPSRNPSVFSWPMYTPVSTRRVKNTNATRRGTTPKSFLQQITLYRKLLQESRAQLQYKMNHLECGLQKLQTTAMQVAVIQAEVSMKQRETVNRTWLSQLW
ncbi:Dynein heavy chain 17, axonemal [Merluccius polli]|uniref:Dynein heavy chain 17, axonemal n=1 Tax=Merluccius polli TaxID=89951 RepID=A0AA47P9F1_MERPO|nr:Dynein heavy chain 17, axonemal [Merluccius polli]